MPSSANSNLNLKIVTNLEPTKPEPAPSNYFNLNRLRIPTHSSSSFETIWIKWIMNRAGRQCWKCGSEKIIVVWQLKTTCLLAKQSKTFAWSGGYRGRGCESENFFINLLAPGSSQWHSRFSRSGWATSLLHFVRHKQRNKTIKAQSVFHL